MDEIVKKKLDNGLTVLFQNIPHAVSVSIGIWVKAGSRFEEENEAGYTHFLEHMLFKGTEKRTAKQMSIDVERVGGIINAYTSREYTCYYITLIKNEMELGLEILSDMLFHSLLKAEDVKSEGKVIIEELKSYEDSPEDFVQDYYYRNFFKNHNLGKDIIGTRDSIKGVTEESLKKYYTKHYYPPEMILSVCGGVNENEFFDLVDKYYSSKKKAHAIPKERTLPEKSYDVYFSNRDLEQVNFLIGADGYPRDFDKSIKLNLALSILGGGMSSRLFQKIREEEGLCYSISAYPASYSDTGITTISCSTSRELLLKCTNEIINEIKILKKNGFDSHEVDNIKTNMAGTMAIGFEMPEHRMNTMAIHEIYFGKYYSFDERLKAIEVVTKDDLDGVISEVFGIPKLHFSGVGNLKDSEIKNIPNQL